MRHVTLCIVNAQFGKSVTRSRFRRANMPPFTNRILRRRSIHTVAGQTSYWPAGCALEACHSLRGPINSSHLPNRGSQNASKAIRNGKEALSVPALKLEPSMDCPGSLKLEPLTEDRTQVSFVEFQKQAGRSSISEIGLFDFVTKRL